MKFLHPAKPILTPLFYGNAELSVGPISSTQPNPTHCKVKTLDPQTKPTYNP